VLPKQIAKRSKAAPPLEKPTPEAVQARYDKVSPFFSAKLIPLLVVPFPFLLIFLVRHGARAMTWIGLEPPLNSMSLLVFMGAMTLNMVTAMSIGRVIQRKRDAKAPAAAPEDAPDFLRPFGTVMLFAMCWIVLGGILLRFIPGVFRLGHDARLAILMIPAFAGGGLIYWRMRPKTKLNQPFKAGDRWYDAARALGSKVGVRVRKVFRTPAKNANAAATIFGTVHLTQGLLDDLDGDEVYAVLAHEVGHLRHNHVRRNFAITLALTGCALAAETWAVSRFGRNVSPEVRALLDSPMFVMFLLPLGLNFILGPARRRAELEADRFALEETRDPDLVIRALTKIHDLNQTPHRLKPIDEAINTHPSLDKRIASIRLIAAEMGLEIGS
jgi:Zn-dependent protease with chaperone function